MMKRLSATHRLAAVTLLATSALLFCGSSLATGTAMPSPTLRMPFGTLITARRAHAPAGVPHAARAASLTYLSEDAHGEQIVVSGAVYVPQGVPHAGGWPLIGWAHGTTGIADACAPSVELESRGPEHLYAAMMTQLIDHWRARGYAVAATDYEGLGTPGVHPYMNGTSAANTVEDMARAARMWDATIGSRWVAIGHSQGGAAAMFAAARANRRQTGMHLVAAIAMAPGGFGIAGLIDYVRTHPEDTTALSYAPLIVLGAAAAEPGLDLDTLLAPEGHRFVEQARFECLTALWEASSSAHGPMFASGANPEALQRYLQAQDIVNAHPTVPLMVVQGDADKEVAREGIDTVVEEICRRGARGVDYRRYAQADHLSLLEHSGKDIDAYLDQVLREARAPADICTAR